MRASHLIMLWYSVGILAMAGIGALLLLLSR
jgi:hypothetical protein